MEGMRILIEALKENHHVTEEERRKREAIEARKEYEIVKIQEQMAFYRKYLRQAFAERRENFDRMFDTIDKSLETGNMEALNVALGGIVRLAEISPLTMEVDKLVDAYRNDDVPEIEI